VDQGAVQIKNDRFGDYHSKIISLYSWFFKAEILSHSLILTGVSPSKLSPSGKSLDRAVKHSPKATLVLSSPLILSNFLRLAPTSAFHAALRYGFIMPRED